MISPSRLYSSRAESLSSDISRLKRRERIFVIAGLTTFAAAIAAVAAYTVYSGIWLVVAAAVMLAAYIAVRRLDIHNSERIERLTALRAVYQNELAYLSGDFSPFDDGSRYADPSHPFTYDMDVFGPQSLFHRINRTVTTGGSDCLARMLSTLPVDDEMEKNGDGCTDEMGDNSSAFNIASPGAESIGEMGEKKQQSPEKPDFIERIDRQRRMIDRLADLEPLRAEFMAVAHGGRIDTAAVRSALDAVRRMPLPGFAESGVALVAAWLSLCGFLATILLSVFTPLPSGVPVMWGTVQLFAVLMLANGPLREIGRTAGRLSREVRAYEELIEITGPLRFPQRGREKQGNHTLLSPFGGAGGGRGLKDASALLSFRALRRIIDGLDRRGNVLGLVLFDVFLLSDFFLVRRFSRWRRDYIERIGGWIDELCTIDALVSMATFRYNEPQAGSAEIVDSPDAVYEARGLWHPFLGAKAVRNDFTIADAHYYIVTGANMAGKSTFLRSLGVNYILAMNGMPVFAESLHVSLFSLFSSMRTNDDLSHGISYFNAELLRLRQLIDHCKGHRRTLIILDEILKGTNSLDKLNGSRMFLDAISHLPVSGVIATHDLELSRMTDNGSGRFHNLCFEISLSDSITYTYKITPGVARNQNATYLLRNIIADII